MLKKRPYFLFIGILVAVYLGFLFLSPKPVNWKHTYSRKHPYPYGNEATYQLLGDIFPGQEITVSRKPPYVTLQEKAAGSNLIFISDELRIGKEDAHLLLDYVSKGSNVFMAAEYFNGTLADTFGLTTLIRHFTFSFKDSVTVNFSREELQEEPFSFRRSETQYYFDEGTLVPDYAVLGYASDSTANFIRIPFGKGNFYFHSCPLIFTNYNLLHKKDHHRYISKSWSYLPVAATVWDEFYHKGQQEEMQTEMRYILSDEHLRWGWFTLLTFVLLFFIFQSKRRQRIIPVLKPLQNSTLEFVSTVGNLYYQQRNHTNLARKKCIYFLETIRKKYGLRTQVLDGEFVKNLSEKSGVDETGVRQLTAMLLLVERSTEINEKQLLDLNKAIENFNLKSKL